MAFRQRLLHVCCAVLGLVVATASAAATGAPTSVQHPLHVVANTSAYTSVGMSYWESASPVVALVASTHGDQSLFQSTAIKAAGANWPMFTFPLGSGTTVQVATAGHIELHDKGIHATPGPVDAAAVYQASGSTTCMIKGYPSSIPQSVTWTYTVNDCMLPPQGDTLSFADIGTRVAFVTPVSQSLDEKQSSGYSHARLIVLDGQQGTLVSEFNVSIPNPGQAPGSVATQYSGARVGFAFGQKYYVINTTTPTGTISGGEPIDMGDNVDAHSSHMCPMGVFVAFGGRNFARVLMWNPAANAFLPQWNTTGPSAQYGGDWSLVTTTMSVNGEDMNPEGCVVALAWTSASVDRTALTVTSMLTGKQFVSWVSPSSASGYNFPNAVAMDLGYVALGKLASEENSADIPTLVVFSLTSKTPSTPVFTYTTPGSVLDVSIIVSPFKYPPLLQSRGDDAASGEDLVWVAAASTATDASSGDLDVFRLRFAAAV